VETKRFVGSTVNVILTRQTCGQRSSKAAESKHRALGNYFSGRICYMFLISKCRGDWDLGLCTTSGLAFGEPQRSGDFRGKKVFRRRKNRNLSLRCGFPNASLEVVHRPRSRSPLHFDIRNIWCERCLLITESPKPPGHYRYLIWVLGYIPYTRLAVGTYSKFARKNNFLSLGVFFPPENPRSFENPTPP